MPPPTLGTQLNSAESRVKKAKMARDKLAAHFVDVQQQLVAADNEMVQANAALKAARLEVAREAAVHNPPVPTETPPPNAAVLAGG
eukprot:2724059-Amphidinium_carterae.1